MNYAHRWRIAEPDGRRELPGHCRHCGAERLFSAASDDLVARFDFALTPVDHTTVLGEFLGRRRR